MRFYCIISLSTMVTAEECFGAGLRGDRNSDGTCICEEGWKLVSSSTDVCEKETVCSTLSCGTSNSFECNPELADPCVCLTGYHKVNGRCTNIDECALNPSICGITQCIDTDGSYACHCPKGEQVSSIKTCRNINECLLGTHLCNDLAECRDTRRQYDAQKQGSYNCVCPSERSIGYRMAEDGLNCIDIDECAENAGACTYTSDVIDTSEPIVCVNTVGSYHCRCPDSFRYYDGQCYLTEVVYYDEVTEDPTTRAPTTPEMLTTKAPTAPKIRTTKKTTTAKILTTKKTTTATENSTLPAADKATSPAATTILPTSEIQDRQTTPAEATTLARSLGTANITLDTGKSVETTTINGLAFGTAFQDNMIWFLIGGVLLLLLAGLIITLIVCKQVKRRKRGNSRSGYSQAFHHISSDESSFGRRRAEEDSGVNQRLQSAASTDSEDSHDDFRRPEIPLSKFDETTTFKPDENQFPDFPQPPPNFTPTPVARRSTTVQSVKNPNYQTVIIRR